MEAGWLRGRARQLKRHVSRSELIARASGSISPPPGHLQAVGASAIVQKEMESSLPAESR